MPNELLLSHTDRLIWALWRQDGAAVELRAERRDGPPSVGRVVAARVTNVVPSIGSAFLDVGLDRDAYLRAVDQVSPSDSIADLRAGGTVVVQIVREMGESKGVRVSCKITLPGRRLVYMPHGTRNAISRRIVDCDQRSRLEAWLSGRNPADGALIVRTAATDVPDELLEGEASSLRRSWVSIDERSRAARAPVVLHAELPLHLRRLRDAPAGGWDRIVVDDAGMREELTDYLGRDAGGRPPVVELHADARPIFDAHGLGKVVERATRSRVWLGSGGYLVIESTEALVSVDVNTGRSTRGVRHTNLEAAAEIARQLRLRDLGGIIVIDFIDMEPQESWDEVTRALESTLCDDPARTRIVGLSDLGVLQMTRKRTRAPLHEVVTERCTTCAGRGRLAPCC